MQPLKVVASVIGLGAFAQLLVQAAKFIPAEPGHEGELRPEVFFTIFSVIAIAAAVRMITHSRPVYSALYFIMVVLSSAGLFLMLQAEFMAFALVIVYAGAIIITYMFVLMLAQQSPEGDGSDTRPDYDRVPREPAAAAIVGFIMLALFSNMIFHGTSSMAAAPTREQVQARAWHKLDMMPGSLQEIVDQQAKGSRLVEPPHVQVEGGTASVEIVRPGETTPTRLELPESAMPNNLELVGLDLVARFPVSLELAGIILLMAMFGAVVMARKQIELGEDELRQAAGMPKLAFHSDAQEHPHSTIASGGER